MMLRGSLENIGLVFIALLSAELKTTSWLRLIHGQVSAELAFQYDRVVWAAFGNQRGLPALDAVVLGLGKADFLLEEGPAPREQNLSLTVGELRARLVSLGAPVRRLDAVPTTVVADNASLDQTADSVFRRSSVESQRSPSGRLTAALAGLARTRARVGLAVLLALVAAALPFVPGVSNHLRELVAAGQPAPEIIVVRAISPSAPTAVPAAPQPASRAAIGSAPEFNLESQRVPAPPSLPEQPLIDLRFANQPQGWLIKPPFVTWSNGAYRLAADVSSRFVAVQAPVQPVRENVTISATFRKIGGPPGGGYGIIVRHQNGEPLEGSFQGGRYYVLEAADRGEVGVWRRDDDHWVDLLSWTHSDAVQTGGASNQLGVQTIGNTLVFRINGIEVTRQTDAALPSGGGVGIFVGGDGNEVAVDRFSLGPDS